MMDLMLPGRDPEMNDYEAQSALRTLLESEKIQECGDEELLDRIMEQINYNQDMLQRVAALVDGLRSGGGEEDYSAKQPVDRTDSRTIDDFLARFNRSRKAEHVRNLQPLKEGSRYG